MADSDEVKEKTSVLGKFSGSIEQILKIATALIAFTYVFGVVVLNVHLSRYGYHSLGLLQLDYIAAGFWSLAPIVLVGLLIFIIFYVFAAPYIFEEKDAGKSSDWSDKLLSLIAAFVIWGLITGLIFWLLEVDFTWAWAVAGVGGFLIGFCLIFMSTVLFFEVEIEEKNRALLIVMLIWCVVSLPFYLIFFSRFVYQTVPDVWGGGKATEVTLVVKDKDSQVLLESTGIEFTDGDSGKSMPTKLIWTTDKELVVVPANQQIRGVWIDKALITAIIYGK